MGVVQFKRNRCANQTFLKQSLKLAFVGFYRVNYDKHNLLLLEKQLQTNFNAIATKNRAQILNDALELAALDFLDYNTALNLTKYLVNEKKYLPWAAAFNSFREISLATANTHYQEIFKVSFKLTPAKQLKQFYFANRNSL